jgi:hypothetical protein
MPAPPSSARCGRFSLGSRSRVRGPSANRSPLCEHVRAPVIFFAAQIGAGRPQQFDSSAEAFAALEAVNARVVVQVFVIENGGAIDFANGGFGFMIGLDQMARDIRLLPSAQQELCGAQVAWPANMRDGGRVY